MVCDQLMAVDSSLTWLWCLLILALTVAYWYLSRPKNLPPGTAGLPIVGYLPFLGENLHKTFEKLGKRFGNIFHLYLGSRLVVVLNDYSTIQEAFVKNAEIFSGRPHDNVLKESSIDNLGLLANDGEYWREHRRFILTNLKNYGFGKMSFEPLILDEIHQFLNEVKKQAGKTFDIKELLMNSTGNNINIMVTGKRFDYDDPAIRRFHKILKYGETRFPAISLASLMPWLSKIPGADKMFKLQQIRNYLDASINSAAAIASTVRNEYEDGLQSNYIYAFLSERNARIKAKSNDDIFTETGLNHITRDLLVAGTETTATTLLFSLFYMTLNPEIQQKVQNEIDRVIGRERQPSYNDRLNMPYTEAIILEVHRIVSLIPLSLPHRNVKEVTMRGYVIPKNTMIFPNLWAVHHDPNIWGDPETFRPERFIGSDGKLIKTEYVIPFSSGKRACVGEPLARMELFLYFVSLLQQLKFIPPNGKMPSLETYPGIATRPKFRNICAVLRS
ncbi:hypothetical protein CHUAL_007622 [Chamberlinius hualienensis]